MSDYRCENHPRRAASVRLSTKATRAGAPGHPINDQVLLCERCAGDLNKTFGIRVNGFAHRPRASVTTG